MFVCVCVLTNSDDTLACFWCQKLAPDRACSFSCQKPAEKLNCDWSVGADDSTACLFVNKDEGFICFFLLDFFNNLNAKTAAIISSFSKFRKSESIFVFFCQYHLLVKCVMVSGIRRLAPVADAGNRRQKMTNVSST